MDYCLTLLHLTFLIPRTRRKDKKRQVLGTNKYRTSGVLSIDTLWLWTLGLTAECLANVMMVLVCKHTRLEEAVHSVLPRQLDAQLTLLNLSGAFFDGAAVNLAKWHFEFHDPPLLLVFRAGFCSVWTSLAAVLEHSATLPPSLAITYLGGMMLAGLATNFLGRFCINKMLVPVLVAAKMLRHHREIIHVNLADTLWDDVLFYACVCIISASLGICKMGYIEYDASELAIGCLCVPLCFLFGEFVEGHHEWSGVQWGTWRCNVASFMILALSCVLSTYHPPASTYALHRRTAATFCGALSSFNGLSGDTAELVLRGKQGAAAVNLLLNFVTALMFGVLLQSLPHMHHTLFLGEGDVAHKWPGHWLMS